jgi:hypothetical protein
MKPKKSSLQAWILAADMEALSLVRCLGASTHVAILIAQVSAAESAAWYSRVVAETET